MSKVIKSTFKGVYKVGEFLFKAQTLKTKTGARFANSHEERNMFNASNKGLLIDGVNKRLSINKSFEHLAIIAKSGGNKTVSFIMPALLDQANKKTSLIVTDPSGEIFEETSQYMKDKGFNVKTLNPSDLKTTCRFNPFYGLGASDVIEIEKICNTMIMSKYGNSKDPVWAEGGIALLEVLAKCLAFGCPDKLDLPNLNYLIQKFGLNGKDLDEWVLFNSVNPLDINDKSVLNSWLGITKNNEKMLSSYATMVKTALKSVNNRDMQIFLSHNDIDFSLFRKEKTLLYLITPAEDQEYYQFLIDLFYARFFSFMMKKKPKRFELPVYCLLDEFGGSYINNFSTIITNIRKYKVSLSIVMQSINQLHEKYGDKAESIKGGIGSYLVFAGADLKTTTEMSNTIGKTRIRTKKRLTDIKEDFTDLPLINPDEIRTLDDNKAVFVTKNKYPSIIQMLPFFENNTFIRAVSRGTCELYEPTRDNGIELVDIDDL